MKSFVQQNRENQSRATTNNARRSGNRRAAVIHAQVNGNTRAGQIVQMQENIKNSPRMVAQKKRLESAFGAPIQRQGMLEEEELQMKAWPGVLQRQGQLEEEELLQGKFAAGVTPAQFKADTSQQENRTGLPDNLKSGLEKLSGMDMSDVKVHYNSSQPEQMHAYAYTQGTDIHVGSGQERHLPHEAWHIAQQKQGRVSPTMQMNGTAINDDPGLEKEADRMGTKASSHRQLKRRQQ